MRCPVRLSLIFAPSLVLAWSCATVPEAPADDVDPTIPELDASWTPRPKKPGAPLVPVPAPEPDPEPTDAGGAKPSRPPPTFPPSTPRAARGDVVLTEVMFDPLGPEPAGEWIEVYNGRSSARSLAGLTLKDGAGRTHVIQGEPGEVAVAPNAYAVLVRDRAAAADLPDDIIVYEYGAGLTASEGIQLANGGSGAIVLLDGDTEISGCAYGRYDYSEVDGRSTQVDDAGEWSLAPATPGRAR